MNFNAEVIDPSGVTHDFSVGVARQSIDMGISGINELTSNAAGNDMQSNPGVNTGMNF